MLWRPDLYESVLPVEAVRDGLAGEGPTLDFDQLNCRMATIAASDQLHHIFFGDEDRWLQLQLHGAPAAGRLHLSTQAIVTWTRLAARHQLLRRLSYLASHGTLAAELYRPHPYADRLARVLQALAGFLRGASQRQIALALFGRRPVVSHGVV